MSTSVLSDLLAFSGNYKSLVTFAVVVFVCLFVCLTQTWHFSIVCVCTDEKIYSVSLFSSPPLFLVPL